MGQLEDHYSEAVRLNVRLDHRFPQDSRWNLLNWKNTLRRLN